MLILDFKKMPEMSTALISDLETQIIFKFGTAKLINTY